ncbi:MAG: hypothetical protein IKI40_03660 [Treponema sp.]|nr:hypothetical protein [Treponema sp.]
MIKRVLCVLTLSLVLAGSVWADGGLKGLELGGGARFELAAGAMKEHETGNLVVALDAAWPLPLGLSQDGLVTAVGLGAQAGVLFPVGKKSYIDSWWGMDFALGAYVDLKINSLITIRPELAADIRLNMVNSDVQDVHGSFMDFGGRFAVNAVFDVTNGLLVKVGAGYTIFPEKDNVCHYIGFNVGAAYRFN